MRDIRLDPTTGDLDVSSGGLVLTQGEDTTRQKLDQRFSLHLGDWFLNKLIGFPYERDAFKKHTTRSLAILESDCRRCITTCPGVKSLVSLRWTLGADRVYRVSFVVINDQNQRVEVKDFEPGGP